MLHKVFRALERVNEKKNISERYNMLEKELTESDFESLLKVGLHSILDESKGGIAKHFCELYWQMKTAVERGKFEGSGTEVVVKKRVTKVPKIANGCNVSWLDNGLAYAFQHELFLTHFFDSLALLVSQHSVPVHTPFGSASISTDDSITAAVAALGDANPSLEAVLHRVQFHLHSLTAMKLFGYAVLENFGGPGSAGRLAIDLLESQLFHRGAVEQGYVLHGCVDGENLGLTLTGEACSMLGPYPSNVAIIPLLNNLFYVEALAVNEAAASSSANASSASKKRGRDQGSSPAAVREQQDYACLRLFLGFCTDYEDGLCCTSSVRRMGLLSMLGTLIGDNSGIKQTGRRNDILCRSQILDQSLWRLLPFDLLQEIFNCFTDHTVPDTSSSRKSKRARLSKSPSSKGTIVADDVPDALVDDFVMTVYARGAHLIKRHGTALVSGDNIEFVVNALRNNEASYRELLGDASFDELLVACISCQ